MPDIMTETSLKQWATTLTDDRIEYAYGLAKKAQNERWQHFADTGYRAALKRDEKLLIALEKMAESTGKLEESQIGEYKRGTQITHGESCGTTEHQLCREAFRMVDQKTPIRNFEWIYGSAAWLCGYIVR
jgi:hypothetical protein